MANSTAKPKKPHPDFPLWLHCSGRWCKKVRGKRYYFGPEDDPQAALEEWLRVKDDLIAGRKPRPAKDGFRICDLCNLFLEAKQGRIQTQTWREYKRGAEDIVSAFGRNRLVDDLRPEDFKELRQRLTKGRRPKTVHNAITRIRTIFNFAYQNALIDVPVRWGVYFEKPSARELRLDRAKQDHAGRMDLRADQIRELLDIASPTMKAMILLGINVGMGNNDCAMLEFRHIDLDTGILDFARPKTGVPRRAVLWEETCEAIHDAIKARYEPRQRDHQRFVFITKKRSVWFKDTSDNPVSVEFVKLLKRTGHHIKGIGFYSLRRTFETVASGTLDQPAIDLSMGHEGAAMADLYRQHVADDRLRLVADHVRSWLFPEAQSC